jgi:hygromycin-B 7''-O-kinase
LSEASPADLFEQLENLEGYRRYFSDPAAWRPYVEQVCQRHMPGAGRVVRIGVPGTCPTFIVDDRWVIKFFGRLFEGGQSFRVELELGRWAGSLRLPFPPITAAGQLFQSEPGWHWPYLVFSYVSGESIGEVYRQVLQEDKLTLAGWMAEITRCMHSARLPESEIFPPTWAPFVELLEQQRRKIRQSFEEWGCLPEHLLAQLEDFLLPLNELVGSDSPPHLIHADLTADHVLGCLEGGRWRTLAVIDFGDAMIGNLYYELVALHLDLFHAEKPLLAAYLDAYGLGEPARRRLPVRAMNMALLHRFNVLGPVFEREPGLREVASLEELAEVLWDVESNPCRGTANTSVPFVD